MDERATIDDLRRRLAAAEAALAEKVAAESEYREREARFRRLFDTIDEGIVIGEVLCDADGRPVDFRYTELNPALERLSGLKVEDVRGRRITEVLPPEDARYWIAAFGSVVITGKAARFEERVAALDQWYGVNVTPYGPGQIATIYENITERRRTEAALRDREARFRALVTATASMIYRMSPDWRLMYQLDGRDILVDTDSSAESWRDTYLVPEDRATVVAAIEDAVRTRTPFELEHRVRTTTGGIGWVHSRAVPMLGPDGEITEWFGFATGIDARKRAEASLREREERQAFLLSLADALRPLDDPAAAQEVAARMLGTEMDVDRCYYAEFDWPRDVLHVLREYVGTASFSVIGEHPISAFRDLLQFSHRGEPLVCADIAKHPIFSSEIAAYRERGTDGFILIPLIKQGTMAACMCVTMAVPRAWSPAEIELVQEVADRTWDASQRTRAEGAQRASEERFQQFAAASSSALWIRDAATLRMEFVSPAIATIYGVAPEDFLNGVELWAAAILPEDRDLALRHLDEAKRGHVVVHEFRVQRANDRAFRWVRNTDFPLHDANGRVQRIGGIAEDVTDARLAVEHQGVLLAELQHRVRNIMGMMRSLADRSAGSARDVEDYRALLEGRLLALSRVQALLTREANAGGSLRPIVEAEVAAQAHHASQFVLRGPKVALSPKAVEVLTLAFHELATNAMKYGALSVAEGRLSVSWTLTERRGTPWLVLDWVEQGGPGHVPSPRRGFGSELIEARIPYELDGRGRITIAPEGARCHLEFPLKDADSILETDAPHPATISGGLLDMTGAPDLTGRRVLVVEDDFYMAHDTAAALRAAGATVLGPCLSEAGTLDLLDGGTPTHAVLDLNLGGGGPLFEIAHLLRGRGVPLVFLTGYDPAVIPPDLQDVTRLQKPVPFHAIVEAVSRL